MQTNVSQANVNRTIVLLTRAPSLPCRSYTRNALAGAERVSARRRDSISGARSAVRIPDGASFGNPAVPSLPIIAN